MPGLWREFQALLSLVSNQCLREHLPNHTRRLYRWIEGLAYVDSEGRRHTLNALLCEETSPAGARTTFVWSGHFTLQWKCQQPAGYHHRYVSCILEKILLKYPG